MILKTWCLQIWGVNTLSCLKYKNIIVDKNQSIQHFPPHCGIQCSFPSKVCPLRKRLPLSCHKNSSQIFDAIKLWKHTIPLTYNTKTLISNISENHRFSPQMRLIAYPDHKTTLIRVYSFVKKRRRVLALFISIFLRNRSLSDARWFYDKKPKIGKGNLYLTENRLSWNEMCCVSDNHNYMCYTCAKEFLDSSFN